MTRKPVDITDFIEPETETPRKALDGEALNVEARKPDPDPFPDATLRERAEDARKARRGSFFWWAMVLVLLLIVLGD